MDALDPLILSLETNNIELINGNNIHDSYLQFKTDNPQNIVIYLVASSIGQQFNVIPINLIICGNEIITSNSNIQYSDLNYVF